MDYFKQLMKLNNLKQNDDKEDFGTYSPLSGFSNEGSLSKNPYQSILSSQPKIDTQSPPSFEDFLLERGDVDLLVGMQKKKSYEDLIKKQMSKNSATNPNLPDGVNIDSTFYNRKDIYDIKQRLEASGIETPNEKKDKPGLLTRALNLLSAPGQAVTTALYNATDDDKDTKFLKGLWDGFSGSLTSNEDKIKTGSDMLDNMFGERDGNEGVGEKVARFVGGLALDIGLDPTTYLTMGSSALVKGATKTVGKEVTEEAVKGAIKGINGVGDITKAGNVLDLDKQASRIAKTVNEKAIKKRSGMEFSVPFTKIEKEIISADKISEIGKALGLQSTVGKGLDMIGDGAKGVWNFKKADDGLRTSLEAIPEAIGKKFSTSYDINKAIKEGDSLKASRMIAEKEVAKQIDIGKAQVLENAYSNVAEIIKQQQELGVDSTELSSYMEKLKTHKQTKEFDPDALLEETQSYLAKANKEFEMSSKLMSDTERELKSIALERLQKTIVEVEDLKGVEDFVKNSGAEKTTAQEVAERTNNAEKFKKDNAVTYEELGIEKSIDDIKTEKGYDSDWQVKSSDSTKDIESFVKDAGLSNAEFDEFHSMNPKQREEWFNAISKKKMKEAYYTKDGKTYINKKDQNRIAKEMSELRTRYEDISKKYNGDIKAFDSQSKNSIYEPARNSDEVMKRIDDMVTNDKTKAQEVANSFGKVTNDREAELQINEMFKGSKAKNVKASKKAYTEELKKAMADLVKKDVEINPTSLQQAFDDRVKNQIKSNVDEMQGMKKQILRNLGMTNRKGAMDLLDKIIEQKAYNMLDNKSQYFFSPFRPIKMSDLSNELEMLVKGTKEGRKINTTSLIDVAKKMNISETDALNKILDGEFGGAQGNLPTILGRKSRLSDNVQTRLRSEGKRMASDILYGRGISSDFGGDFDKAVEVLDKSTGETIRATELMKNGVSMKDIRNTPSKYKIVQEGGVTQRIEEAIDDLLSTRQKDTKFYDLTKAERDNLMSEVNKTVNDILDKDGHFSGNYDINTGQNITNYDDKILKSERAYDVANNDKVPLRDKKQFTDEEFTDSQLSKKHKNVDSEIKKMISDIRAGSGTNKIEALDNLRGDVESQMSELENLLNSNGISSTEYHSTRREISKLKNTVDMIDKETDIIQQMEKVNGNPLSKFKEDIASKNGRNTVVNSDSWGVPNKTINASTVLDEAPTGYKSEKARGQIKDLQDMYEAKKNMREWEKANRTADVKFSSTIDDTKDIRASIDMSKQTPEQLKKIFDEIGIKDDKFDEAYSRFVNAKRDNEFSSMTKDAISKAWSTKDVKAFEGTMSGLYGDAFRNSWDKKKQDVSKKQKEFAKNNTVPLTPMELIAENKEVVEALGGGEKAEKFIQDYTKLMSDFATDEKQWGVLQDTVKSQGYVARRMSDETRELLNGDADKNNFIEAYFRRRKELIVDDQAFTKHRKMSDGTMTIKELNQSIYEATAKEFGEEGAIKNFFEKDLSRIMIQRAYEHGSAFYDKGMQDLYLDTLGVGMSWAKATDGSAYNIVENINGARTIDDMRAMFNKQDWKGIKNDIENFMPNASYLPDDKLQKIKDNAMKSWNDLDEYLKSDRKSKKEYKELKKKLDQSMPQRMFARELKSQVKQGNMKLIYPSGQNIDVDVRALKDEGVNKILDKSMSDTRYSDAKHYAELTWEDFEKISASSKEVPVFAVDKQVYEAYEKAMTKQFTKDSDNFLKVYDKFTNTWKKMATLSVGFHTRNAFGNQLQMYLDVGAKSLDPRWLKVANEVKKDSAKVLFTSKDGTEYTGKMVNDLFKQVGLGETGQLNNEFNKARKGKISIEELLSDKKAPKTKNPFTALSNKSQELGETIEQTAKRQQFSILLEQGLDPLEAKQHVDKYLFDYSDLTDFETDFMKRIMPFYTFMRKNTELQFDTLLNNPTPIKTVRRILDNQRKSMVSTEQEQLLTDNDKDKVILGGKTKRTVSTNLPWLEELNPLGALNPIIKTPLELATNKNLTFGNDIEAYEGQMKKTGGIEQLIGSILGQTEKSKNGETYINAKAKHLITNSLPSVRTADRSMQNLTQDDKLGGMMALLGLGGQEFSVDKRTSQNVRELKEMLENTEKKAQSMGINTREELKKKQELEKLLASLTPEGELEKQQEMIRMLSKLNIR